MARIVNTTPRDVADYRYDVFLSYRRHTLWPEWVRIHFLELLLHYLGEELGRDAVVFCDNEIAAGNNWPNRLASALAHSRVLVPLLSRQYFSSMWCVSEFAFMRAREVRCGLGTPEEPGGLIVPALLHDGDDFPEAAAIVQPLDLRACASRYMSPDSAKKEALEELVARFAPAVVAAIYRAPPYDPTWLHLSAERFIELFHMPESRQHSVPRLEPL
jgi:hypothetical protein